MNKQAIHRLLTKKNSMTSEAMMRIPERSIDILIREFNFGDPDRDYHNKGAKVTKIMTFVKQWWTGQKISDERGIESAEQIVKKFSPSSSIEMSKQQTMREHIKTHTISDMTKNKDTMSGILMAIYHDDDDKMTEIGTLSGKEMKGIIKGIKGMVDLGGQWGRAVDAASESISSHSKEARERLESESPARAKAAGEPDEPDTPPSPKQEETTTRQVKKEDEDDGSAGAGGTGKGDQNNPSETVQKSRVSELIRDPDALNALDGKPTGNPNIQNKKTSFRDNHVKEQKATIKKANTMAGTRAAQNIDRVTTTKNMSRFNEFLKSRPKPGDILRDRFSIGKRLI